MHELRRGGLSIATPVNRICINWLICLIHSGLLSRRKRKKEKKKEKSRLQRTFPRHHDPKSGHNLCCHKFDTYNSSMCPSLVLPFHVFPLNACSIPGQEKSLPFLLCLVSVWLLYCLLFVSRIILYSPCFDLEGNSLDTKVAFASNSRSPRQMQVFTRSS